jgi:hypothetical protein
VVLEAHVWVQRDVRSSGEAMDVTVVVRRRRRLMVEDGFGLRVEAGDKGGELSLRWWKRILLIW